MQVYYRFLGDESMAQDDILYGLKRVTMDAVPGKGDVIVFPDYTAHEVMSVAWVADRKRYVPMLTLSGEALP